MEVGECSKLDLVRTAVLPDARGPDLVGIDSEEVVAVVRRCNVPIVTRRDRSGGIFCIGSKSQARELLLAAPFRR